MRELESAIERAATLCRADEVDPADLPKTLHRPAEQPGGPGDPGLLPADDFASWPKLEEIERRYIRKVLDALGGNKTLAARTPGLDRKTLRRSSEPRTHEDTHREAGSIEFFDRGRLTAMAVRLRAPGSSPGSRAHEPARAVNVLSP